MSTSKQPGTVLLVMDVQKKMMGFIPDSQPLLNEVKRAVDAARIAGIQVIYAILSFRPGYPEISPNNTAFSAVKNSGGLFVETDEGTAIHPQVSPEEGDLIVHKKRVSAFAGSGLETLLKGLEASHLVLSGYATSGIVLSTLREAADKDFGLTVLSDACADGDQESHDVLMNKIFPKQATVVTTQEWVASLTR